MQSQCQEVFPKNQLKARSDLFALIKELGLEYGDFTLASGQKSSVYLDCRQVYFRAQAQFLIGEIFWQFLVKLEENSSPFTAVGGMAMGAIPLALALQQAAFRRGRDLAAFTVRKENKDHGTKSLIEGAKCLFSGSKILLVEDVVSTGKSSLQALEALIEYKITPKNIFAIIDREMGGENNLLEAGLKMQAIFKLSEFL